MISELDQLLNVGVIRVSRPLRSIRLFNDSKAKPKSKCKKFMTCNKRRKEQIPKLVHHIRLLEWLLYMT